MIVAYLTKSQALEHHNLQMTVFAWADRVFSVTDKTDVPFNKCLAMCDQETRDNHANALSALTRFERQMLSEGRGYSDQWGHFKPNRRAT